MIWVARSRRLRSRDGVGWELDAIAAVFIGGAAVSGGIGTVVGSIIGGLVIAVLNNGLQLLGVGIDRVQIIKGLVLLVAVGIDVYSKSQGRPSIIGMLTRNRKTGCRDGTRRLPVPERPRPDSDPTLRSPPPSKRTTNTVRRAHTLHQHHKQKKVIAHAQTRYCRHGDRRRRALALSGLLDSRRRHRHRPATLPASPGLPHRCRAARQDLGELGARRRPVHRRPRGTPASRPTCSTPPPPTRSPTSRTRSQRWSPTAPRSSSSAPRTAAQLVDPGRGGQRGRRDRHRVRPPHPEHRGRRLLRRVRQLQGRRAAGPGPARRHRRPKYPGQEDVQHRAVRRFARRQQRRRLLQRRDERPPAEDRRRHPQGRLGSDRRSSRSRPRAGSPQNAQSRMDTLLTGSSRNHFHHLAFGFGDACWILRQLLNALPLEISTGIVGVGFALAIRKRRHSSSELIINECPSWQLNIVIMGSNLSASS